jgi:SOS-response transcriptional repressor LexA
MATDKPRLSVTLDEETMQTVIDYQHEYRLRNTTKAFCELLAKGISALELEKEAQPTQHNISIERSPILEKYRCLDSRGKVAIETLLNFEYAHCMGSSRKKEKGPMCDLIVYTDPAAAGNPLDASCEAEHVSVPENTVPKGTDFGIRIQGHSMEPTIMDGDIVRVHFARELRDGQIGIFMLDGNAACKRYREKNGKVTLESDSRGRKFESSHPDQQKPCRIITCKVFYFSKI